MQVAIVGCGFVADYYIATLANYPELEVRGVFDRDPDRLARFAAHHRLRSYASFAELLEDRSVELVMNLTNPGSHFAVSSALLDAGKHVYSEKPLATRFADAEALVEKAESRGLLLASAPCTVLGETAQTLWKALRDQRIGTPRVVYAEMDDGPIPFENFGTWKSVSGAPWPAKDEFEVGCTLEHAGYCLTWLTAFFGPARSITSFAHSLLPDKGIPLDRITPDFTVGSIEFVSGVVARLTCGIFAAPDRSLRIFGDGGILSTRDSWNSASPVYHSRRNHLGLKAEKHPVLAKWVGLGPGRVPLVRRPNFRWAGRPANYIDFARGVAEVAASVREKRPARLSARWSLHVNELALTLQDPATYGAHRLLKSTFEPMQPMPWSD